MLATAFVCVCVCERWEHFTCLRAFTSVDAKSFKIQKSLHFTHFGQKNTHINGCKIVHKCTIATVIVHICMVTVALAFNILIISSLSLSLGFGHLTSLSLSSFDQIMPPLPRSLNHCRR